MPLQFSVDQSALVYALGQAVGSVEKATRIPILGNVKIESDGDHLNLFTSDMQLSFKTRMAAEIKSPGSVTIPARRLLEQCSMLPSGSKIDVSIGENAWASIKCGKSRMRIPGIAPEAFPELPNDTEFAAVATANLKALARSLGRVMHVVSVNGVGTAAPGVAKVDIGLDKTVIVSTDGHRLPLVETDIKGDIASGLMVPSKATAEIIRLSGTAALDTKVTIAQDENNISFSMAGGWTLYARMQSGGFPDYKMVTGRFKAEDGWAVVSAKGLKDCISRVRGFATGETRTIKITIGESVLRISAVSSDAGEASDEVECECKGAIEAGFNANYMMDFIASCSESESIRIEFGGKSAFRFMPAEKRDGESYSEIIMPISI